MATAGQSPGPSSSWSRPRPPADQNRRVGDLRAAPPTPAATYTLLISRSAGSTGRLPYEPANTIETELRLESPSSWAASMPDGAFAERGARPHPAVLPLRAAAPAGLHVLCSRSTRRSASRAPSVELHVRSTETPQDSFDVTSSGSGSSSKNPLDHTVTWEYWNGRQWTPLFSLASGAANGPEALTASGEIDLRGARRLRAARASRTRRALAARSSGQRRLRLLAGGHLEGRVDGTARRRFTYVIHQPPALSDFRVELRLDVRSVSRRARPGVQRFRLHRPHRAGEMAGLSLPALSLPVGHPAGPVLRVQQEAAGRPPRPLSERESRTRRSISRQRSRGSTSTASCGSPSRWPTRPATCAIPASSRSPERVTRSLRCASAPSATGCALARRRTDHQRSPSCSPSFRTRSGRRSGRPRSTRRWARAPASRASCSRCAMPRCSRGSGSRCASCSAREPRSSGDRSPPRCWPMTRRRSRAPRTCCRAKAARPTSRSARCACAATATSGWSRRGWRGGRARTCRASAADDRHYVLDRGRGGLRFGDGERGRIPPLGADVLARELPGRRRLDRQRRAGPDRAAPGGDPGRRERLQPAAGGRRCRRGDPGIGQRARSPDAAPSRPGAAGRGLRSHDARGLARRRGRQGAPRPGSAGAAAPWLAHDHDYPAQRRAAALALVRACARRSGAISRRGPTPRWRPAHGCASSDPTICRSMSRRRSRPSTSTPPARWWPRRARTLAGVSASPLGRAGGPRLAAGAGPLPL